MSGTMIAINLKPPSVANGPPPMPVLLKTEESAHKFSNFRPKDSATISLKSPKKPD